MNLLYPALLIIVVLFILLLLTDRITQHLGRSPALWFDTLQLVVGITGISLHAVLIGGTGWAMRFFAVTLLLPTLIELIGLRSGFPFGRYHYTSTAGPRFPGGVPLAVTLMWWGLLYVSLNAAITIIGIFSNAPNNAYIVVIAAFAVTGWDVVGDPVAVHAGFWRWEKPGRWCGIPAVNFLGWLIVAAFTMSAAYFFAGPFPEPATSSVSRWIFSLPTALFGLLLFDYAGAAFRRGITRAGWWGLGYGFVLIIFYLLAVGAPS